MEINENVLRLAGLTENSIYKEAINKPWSMRHQGFSSGHPWQVLFNGELQARMTQEEAKHLVDFCNQNNILPNTPEFGAAHTQAVASAKEKQIASVQKRIPDIKLSSGVSCKEEDNMFMIDTNDGSEESFIFLNKQQVKELLPYLQKFAMGE